jgi:plastocyanin
MQKQLSGSICLGGLLVIGLLLWQPQARAADDTTTVNIIPGPTTPLLDPTDVKITAGQSIKWVPQPQEGGTPHHLFQTQKKPDGKVEETTEITPEFNRNDFETATHKFETSDRGTINYRCKIHPKTMIGTITVK